MLFTPRVLPHYFSFPLFSALSLTALSPLGWRSWRMAAECKNSCTEISMGNVDSPGGCGAMQRALGLLFIAAHISMLWLPGPQSQWESSKDWPSETAHGTGYSLSYQLVTCIDVKPWSLQGREEVIFLAMFLSLLYSLFQSSAIAVGTVHMSRFNQAHRLVM